MPVPALHYILFCCKWNMEVCVRNKQEDGRCSTDFISLPVAVHLKGFENVLQTVLVKMLSL